MDEAWAASIASRRYRCAGLWLVTLALGLLGTWNGELLLLAWLGAVAMSIVTVSLAAMSRDERVVHPRMYRGIAVALLGVAVAGVVLGLLRDASGWSRVFAPYFGLIALLGYRALVAREPGPAVLAAAVSVLAWLPFGFVTLVGCRKGMLRVVSWTEPASQWLLRLALALAVVLAAVALIAFRRRADAVPDARLVHGSR